MPVTFKTISAAEAGQRIDNFLLTQLKGVPKSHIYRVIRKGEVRVNKKRIKPEYKLQANDDVRIPPVRVAERPTIQAVPDSLRTCLTTQILLEDEHCIIMNKPAGIAVHGGSEQPFGIIEAFRIVREDLPFVELAHRLDRDTSGCLLMAKSRAALRELHSLIRKGQMEKRYDALVKGRWPRNLNRVDLPLLPYQRVAGEQKVIVSEEGKSARTHFKVIKNLSETTWIEAKLDTGRMHQIRVHCSEKGYPIVGDLKYGDRSFNKEMRRNDIKRLFLHAKSLKFRLMDQDYAVFAPMGDLENTLREL